VTRVRGVGEPSHQKDGRIAVDEYKAALRAKVEAWHDKAEATYRAEADHYYEGSMDAYSVVLDLIEDPDM